ncbi:hypothetical protein Celaphus_00006827 [Cervus elaphus hippelaphus]|uniref:Claudin n=1 Tax=Cervus elaphus hippelaphus TaxID=46360 RepID=A0A212CYX9_CEREH|nr:hypothetical protein Celaphus_00006827 [Cervus elaphus hippelaphus]
MEGHRGALNGTDRPSNDVRDNQDVLNRWSWFEPGSVPCLSPSLAMASAGLQILGIVLTLFGWVNALVSCTLPLWKVTAFIGNSIVVAQVVWEGLWMSCVVQSTGQMQCKVG